jgi:two-component system chemotaxis response regulator CheB
LGEKDKVVVIGASTGGPRALNQVLPQLSANLPAAFVIVQHMPVGFTRSLAERLNSLSELMVKEAEPGDQLEVGKALVAPGGFHLVFDKNGAVSLNQNPTVHGVRPAVDVTLISVAQNFGKATVAVVLTGMGKDGANGAVLTHSLGGKVIAEDESSCVVWGMPRSVIEAGAADQVAPLSEIPDAIVRAVQWN